MEALIDTFYIDIKLVIAQLFNFAVVFVVLYIWGIKPLMKVMKERTLKIEKGIKDANENSLKLEKTEKDYCHALNVARSEAQEILSAAKKDAEARKTEMVAAAKNEVGEVVKQGKAQLAQEKLRMIEEAKEQVIEIVTQVTGKVLGTKLESSVEKELVAQSIKELK